jgi:hypothetical protein
MKSEKKTTKFWWPDVSTQDDARSAAKGGATAAWIVAVVTSGFALYAALKAPVLNVTAWSFLDAALFAALGFGIWRLSRLAAIGALVLYLVEQGFLWASVGPKNPVMALLFIMFFVGGIRGTFSYHRLRNGRADTGSTSA